MTHNRSLKLPIAAGVVLLLSLALAACGGGSATKADAGNSTDVAFVDGMVPHHRSAIDMAKTAETRGQSKYVKTLASNIIQSQGREISTMEAIKKQLSGVKKGDLGMNMSAMGMAMDDSKLKTANPFDRMFVDMMIPHHQGAIRMARVELAKGKNSQLKGLAHNVIAAQAKEINSMNAFRARVFGSPSPAGGVPKEGGSSMTGMNH